MSSQENQAKLEFLYDEETEQGAKIKVAGVGGAGGNAVNRMIESELKGVEFIAINTDYSDLNESRARTRIQIGERITKGLGAGADPNIGSMAAQEDKEVIAKKLEGSDMVFITAGMGGGTGTGAAPIVAEIAKNLDILTVAIVTRPFNFEGKIRERNAIEGMKRLKEYVDTLIVIPNQRLLSIVDRHTTLSESFKMADDILFKSTKGISDLITVHGLINLDFADVRTIMKGMGEAIMGTGYAKGENKAILAADQAIHSPLLDDVSIAGAKGVLINITGGKDLALYDVHDATSAIYDAVGQDGESNIIFGAVIDEKLNDEIYVTVIATGFNREATKKKSSAVEISSVPELSSKIVEVNFKREEFPREERKPEADKPRHIVPAIPGFETPAYIRNLKSRRTDIFHEEVFINKGEVKSQKLDNIEIPTFLRKQMD